MPPEQDKAAIIRQEILSNLYAKIQIDQDRLNEPPEQIFNRAPILDGAIENGFHFLEYVARFEYRDTRAEVAWKENLGGRRAKERKRVRGEIMSGQ